MDEHLHNDPLEDFFRRSLDDFGDEPSDDVWSNLDERLALHESGLSAETITEPSSSFVTNLSNSILWKWGSVVLIVGLLSLLSYHIYQQRSEIANLSEHIDQQTHTIEQLNDKVENLQPSATAPVNASESTSTPKNVLQNIGKPNSENKADIADRNSNSNKLQHNHSFTSRNSNPAMQAKEWKEKEYLQRNSIEASKNKTTIVGSDLNRLQKNVPFTSITPPIEEKQLKKKEVMPRNSIEASKNKTTIAGNDLDGFQKNTPVTSIKPPIKEKQLLQKNNTPFISSNLNPEGKTNELKEKGIVLQNTIEATKDNATTAADMDGFEKSEPSHSLDTKGLEDEVKIETFKSTSTNTDEVEEMPATETLEEDTPPLMTEENIDQNKAAEKSSTTLKNAQDSKEKKIKTKQSKKKKGKPTKVNSPKKKPSKPEGALAENPSDSEEEKEASVEEEKHQPPPKTPSTSKKKWSVAAIFAPSHSFRRIRDKRSKEVVNELNAKEKAAFSYDAGIEVGYQLTPKWSLKSGIQYRQVQQTSTLALRLTCNQIPNSGKKIFDCKAKEVKGSFGEIDIDFRLTDDSINDGDEIDLTVEHTQALNWLRLPLLTQYKLGKGKWKASITGGLAANFLLNETPTFRPIRPRDRRFQHTDTRRQRPPSTNPQTPKISKSHLEYVVGLGVEYQATDKLQFFVEPRYSAALKPVFENKNIQTTPYSMSGNMGVRFSF